MTCPVATFSFTDRVVVARGLDRRRPGRRLVEVILPDHRIALHTIPDG
jgi:hypothetical protein